MQKLRECASLLLLLSIYVLSTAVAALSSSDDVCLVYLEFRVGDVFPLGNVWRK